MLRVAPYPLQESLNVFSYRSRGVFLLHEIDLLVQQQDAALRLLRSHLISDCTPKIISSAPRPALRESLVNFGHPIGKKVQTKVGRVRCVLQPQAPDVWAPGGFL